MTSYKKEDNVFTRNPLGGKPGESDGLKKVTVPSGHLLSAYPQDNVHGVDLEDCYGGSFGGSDTNLSHSLTGPGAVQAMAPRSGKSTKAEI